MVNYDEQTKFYIKTIIIDEDSTILISNSSGILVISQFIYCEYLFTKFGSNSKSNSKILDQIMHKE